MNEKSQQASILPYGPAIHEALVSGDLEHMRKVAEQAKEYLAHAEEVRPALEKLMEVIKQADC